MKNLVINDLPMSKELDRKALSTIAGGKTNVTVIFSIGFKFGPKKRSQGKRSLRPQLGYDFYKAAKQSW